MGLLGVVVLGDDEAELGLHHLALEGGMTGTLLPKQIGTCSIKTERLSGSPPRRLSIQKE